MGRRPKKPTIDPAKVPSKGKKSRAATQPNSVKREKLAWHFGRLDFDGPWCATVLDHGRLRAVVKLLKNFESMTWSEIEGRNNHFVSRSDLCTRAQHRLEEIAMDDTDELFSLRIGGSKRVWGIRDGAVLKLLWWDPEHEVCPSLLRNT